MSQMSLGSVGAAEDGAAREGLAGAVEATDRGEKRTEDSEDRGPHVGRLVEVVEPGDGLDGAA